MQLALVAVLCGACCGPRIRSFDVQPHTLCLDDEIVVARWDASGDLEITGQLDPPTQQLPNPDDKGEKPPSATPDSSHLLMLRLTARRNGQEVPWTRWVQKLPRTFSNEIAFPTRLVNGRVVASGSKNPTRWGDRFVIATIAAGGGQRIEVSHAGRTVYLGTEPSNALRDAPLEGEWELTWHNDGRDPPESLSVLAVVRCKERTP